MFGAQLAFMPGTLALIWHGWRVQYMPALTSGVYAFALAIVAFVLFSEGLYLGAIPVVLNALGWIVVWAQRTRLQG